MTPDEGDTLMELRKEMRNDLAEVRHAVDQLRTEVSRSATASAVAAADYRHAAAEMEGKVHTILRLQEDAATAVAELRGLIAGLPESVVAMRHVSEQADGAAKEAAKAAVQAAANAKEVERHDTYFDRVVWLVLSTVVLAVLAVVIIGGGG